MSYLNVGEENGNNIELYYEDLGEGTPVILIHGWPLSGASWEKQVMPLLQSGHRVITYDRRGFGQSSRPYLGYNYETLAEDLRHLILKLDLSNVTLVGFSMGNGEIARYLGKFGTDRVSRAAFLAPILPSLLKKEKSQESGVDMSIFDGIQQGLLKDRPAFLTDFFKNFFNIDEFEGKRISKEVFQYSWNVAVAASPIATFQCTQAWKEDFRKDIQKIDIPTLLVHGTGDRILPIDVTARPLSKMIKGCKFIEIKDAPHGFLATHAEEINKVLMDFLNEKTTDTRVTGLS